MSESKRKQISHAEIIRNFPVCIYCRTNPSTSIDHCPPKIVFRNKDRPRGLEIPACDACNQGSSYSDIVASLLSHAMPTADAPENTDDFRKLLQAAQNNMPGFLEEMWIGRGGQKIAAHKLRHPIDGGLLRVNGPITTQNMEAFALRVTCALHFDSTKKPIPSEAGICARWFSNYDRLSDVFPIDAFNNWPPSQMLIQGKKTSFGEFEYVSRISDDGSIGAHLATFRFSFAIVGFVAFPETLLLNPETDIHPRIYTPPQLGALLKSLKNS